MYYQIEQVLEKQQIETEKFYKGRGILICETSGGLFALKEFHGQTQKAEYLYNLGTFLQKQNVSCDYMVKNKEDLLITEGIDGVKYTFHHWVKGRECDVKSRMDVVMTVSFLAKFHEVCEKIEETAYNSENIYQEYQRHDRELRRIRKYIMARHDKSDFERLYLKCFPEFIHQSENVLQFLAGRKEIVEEHTMGVCHGDFNQHNVVIDSEGMTLIHMERARYDAQVADLSNFLRKIMEKHEWNETLGLEMLREYCRIHDLNDADWQELYCRLCYPEKFWKIANRYYNSRKVWDSGKNHEKLQKEIRHNVSRQKFLEVLKRARL